MSELLARLILGRIHELQGRVDAGDVAAHLLRERLAELRDLLSRCETLPD